MLSRFARLRKVARTLTVASPRINQQIILRRSLATTSSTPKIIQFALSDIGEGTKEVVVKGKSLDRGKFHCIVTPSYVLIPKFCVDLIFTL